MFSATLFILRDCHEPILGQRWPYYNGPLGLGTPRLCAHYEQLDQDLKAELPLKRIWTLAAQEDD